MSDDEPRSSVPDAPRSGASALSAVNEVAERLTDSVVLGMHYGVMLNAVAEVEKIAAAACDAEVLADVLSGARLIGRRLYAVRRAATAAARRAPQPPDLHSPG